MYSFISFVSGMVLLWMSILLASSFLLCKKGKIMTQSVQVNFCVCVEIYGIM